MCLLIDLDAGIRHAGGSRALYLRFLRRFPADPSFSDLRDALQNGDVPRAFLCAHTFKGLAAQLGLAALCGPADALCELLRPLDPAALPACIALCASLAPVYENTLRAISSIEDYP